MRKDGNRGDWQTVLFVNQYGVFGYEILSVFLTPQPQSDHRGQQIEPLGRQSVFDFAAIILARFTPQDAVID